MELPYTFSAQDVIEQGRTTHELVKTMKTWVLDLEDKNVPSRIQDEKLILFLLSCKNDIEFTKKTIISHYKCKKNAPEIHDDYDMETESLKLGLNTFHLCSIPGRTEENYAIQYYKIHDSNYRNFEIVTGMKMSLMLVDVSQEDNPPDGLIVMIDMKGFGLMHLMKLKLGAMIKYFQYLQEGQPLQIKAIHIINSVYFMDKLMALLKLCMKSELINLMHLHLEDMPQEELHQIIPRKFLPMEYGGDLPSVDELHEITLKQFRKKQDFWKLEEQIRKESQ